LSKSSVPAPPRCLVVVLLPLGVGSGGRSLRQRQSTLGSAAVKNKGK
jgi:hypothetical protein